jgi:3D (Asp-Asp-Asp) domain-containing protein
VDLKANPNQKVIAVDPSVIPLGSKVYVEGYGEAVAADTGGAIKGSRIDVFVPSESDAQQFGRKSVKITVMN